MTEQEIRRELEAILKEAQDRAELLGAVLELLDAERAQSNSNQTHDRDRSAEMERTQPDMSSLIAAVADGILWGARYGNAHGEQIIWMLPDGTFGAYHDTDRTVPDGALEILRVGHLDDLLGPYWSEDLPLDEDGRPDVSRELATELASWWVGEFGQSMIDEAEYREEEARG